MPHHFASNRTTCACRTQSRPSAGTESGAARHELVRQRLPGPVDPRHGDACDVRSRRRPPEITARSQREASRYQPNPATVSIHCVLAPLAGSTRPTWRVDDARILTPTGEGPKPARLTLVSSANNRGAAPTVIECRPRGQRGAASTLIECRPPAQRAGGVSRITATNAGTPPDSASCRTTSRRAAPLSLAALSRDQVREPKVVRLDTNWCVSASLAPLTAPPYDRRRQASRYQPNPATVSIRCLLAPLAGSTRPP